MSLAAGVLVLATLGCTQSDQDKARARAEEARRKARQDAHALARDAKQAARSLDNQIHRAMNGNQSGAGATDSADAKLRRGGDDLRAAGSQASVRIDHAAMIAKIKAKLANDVGLSTVAHIDVDESGRVVTLRGTVDSPEQRAQAEHAVMQVDGVSKVVNDLKIQP
ncbi:MAG: BON domain-containing protein [Acidobacteriaceae bacterium]|nr:BON domain-containing protein [Acidobacteriaceae bacterium]